MMCIKRIFFRIAIRFQIEKEYCHDIFLGLLMSVDTIGETAWPKILLLKQLIVYKANYQIPSVNYLIQLPRSSVEYIYSYSRLFSGSISNYLTARNNENCRLHW